MKFNIPFFSKKNSGENILQNTSPYLQLLIKEFLDTDTSYYGVETRDLKSFQLLKDCTDEEKKKYIFEAASLHNTVNRKGYDNFYGIELCCRSLINTLLRSKIDYAPEELLRLFQLFRETKNSIGNSFFHAWPIGLAAKQFNYIAKKSGTEIELKQVIQEILSWKEINSETQYYGSDLAKIRTNLSKLIHDGGENSLPPYRLDKDNFGDYVNESIDRLSKEEKHDWYALFHHCLTASAGKPSKKFLGSGNEIIDKIKIDKFKTITRDFFSFVANMKAVETIHHHTYNGQEYTHSTYTFLADKNNTLLKGLVWLFARFHDTQSVQTIGKLCEKCFEKIPGVGPSAAAVGNACMYTLANSKGLEGIGQLSRLKLKIRQNNTRNLLQKYLDEASLKLKISPEEIEEMAVPDFGLENGSKSYSFDGYSLRVSIEKIGKIKQEWFNPEGKIQKSVPAIVKQDPKLTAKLKKVREEIKSIQKYLSAQRDRIDRSFILDRSISKESFDKYYLNHGLVSFIARKLIWNVIRENRKTPVIYKGNNTFQNIEGKEVTLEESDEFSLWHPMDAEPESVLNWRSQLEEMGLQQPIKQAFREVYILTDAEVNTKTYSNRMAAHILKQHQFNALAGVRGWRYTLMGAFDDGRYNEAASLYLPSYDILAEYWINELNADDQWTDSGIWNYITTDQVRFIQGEETLNLKDVPKVVFSEVMRDVDLFVGVASVGNDPEWQDNGGLTEYRDYWTSYSFGDLTEVAKTRKAVLENLIPKLAIRNVARIEGKFLIVQGKVRTYKIHIGSTNILMEPNDQYLCIVPDRKSDTGSEKVFLPFEGDRGLSLVLSKALLLANDDKITDQTILSQIGK